MKRIGIYSGTFNPVHAGHLSFALQAIKEAKLDRVYFLPERHNRHKSGVEHFGHRVAMLKQALKPYPNLGLIESSEVSFTVEKTLPKLQNQFHGSRLVFLFGSDSLEHMPSWPNVARMLSSAELVVGIREGDQETINGRLAALPVRPKRVTVIESYAATVSSTKVREALRLQRETEGVLPSVKRYSNQNWLYISLAES